MKITVKVIVPVLVVVMVAAVASAQFAKPDDAVKYRKSVMTLIATHFKRLGAMVQGKAPYDPQVFAANAEVVKLMSTLPWEASLMPGSDRGDTTLSPAVFQKEDAFRKTAASFEAAAATLAEAARSGDLEAVKAPFGTVAQTCKACHKPFRK